MGNAYYYYLYNGHGDVIALTDESGQIVNRYSYDEWGNIKNKQETISNPIRYGGEYFDEESGLYYLRARYYDPTIGRFISKDSVEGDITNPLSLNLYTYCNNNPILFVDPTGHQPGDANLPRGTLAVLEAAGRAYNAAKAIGDTAGMAMAHNTAEIARGWAGYCSYNGVTMTPGQRDSIISSSSYRGGSSYSSGSSYRSSGGNSSNYASDSARQIWNNEFASAKESQRLMLPMPDSLGNQPVSVSKGYVSIPVPLAKAIVGGNVNIDIATGGVYGSIDVGGISGTWATWSPGKPSPGLSASASCYLIGGTTAGLTKNAANSIGIGCGGGVYGTLTTDELFSIYFWR